MRKTLTITFFVLVILSLLTIWQRESVLTFIRPVKIVRPIYKQPSIYDLTAMLEKNGLTATQTPILINDTIQATISGVMVLFNPDKDFFTQVRSLQLVLPQLKMDSKVVREIDLRFNKVVIRY